MGPLTAEFVVVPTCDTPGTLLSLNFQDGSKYLVGRPAEGTNRAIAEISASPRKVCGIFLSGTTRWENIGGLLGLLLNMSDAKNTSFQTTQDSQFRSTKLIGPRNLNHAIAAARKFIFRTKTPLHVKEFPSSDPPPVESSFPAPPSWQDDNLMAWVLPISPSTAPQNPADPQPDHTSGTDPSEIVPLLFNSSWAYGKLEPQLLSALDPGVQCYVSDPDTGSITPYTGARRGEEGFVDITVFARLPWPGSVFTQLTPAKPDPTSLSYIFRPRPGRGKFNVQKAIELRVPKGKLWSDLASGMAVQNEDGQTITSEMVLEPPVQLNGLAVIDLLDESYIDGLVNKPEWYSEEIMNNIVAIVWILPSNLWLDSRLIEFRNNLSHLKHILCSPEYSPNVVVFDRAAMAATQHHWLEPTVFPALHYEIHPELTADVQIAERNLTFRVDPNYEPSRERCRPIFDSQHIQDMFSKEVTQNEDFADVVASLQDTELPELDSDLTPYSDVEITVLGTGSSHPSPYRNVSGTVVEVPNWGKCLLDCGEGTLNNVWRLVPSKDRAKWLSNLNMIWISHLHADHHLGTFSVIKEWMKVCADTPDRKLAIVSHISTLDWLFEYFAIDEPQILSRLMLIRAFSVPHHPSQSHISGNPDMSQPTCQRSDLVLLRPQLDQETGKERLVREDDSSSQAILTLLKLQLLNAVAVDHCKGAMAVCITFQSGFKISYSGDCIASLAFAREGRGSHVVIHEATLEDEMRVDAIAKKHSTPGEALIVAAEMKARLCLLTHFSQRYPKMPPIGVTNGNASDVEKAEDVLTNDLDTAPEQEDPAMTDAYPPNAAEVEGVKEEPAVSHLLDAPEARSRVQRQLRKTTKLIDQALVQRFLEKVGTKVVFAFDYMRFRLGHLPQLQRVQPVLREMYDRGIGGSFTESFSTEAQKFSKGQNLHAMRQREEKKRINALKSKGSPEKRQKTRSGEKSKDQVAAPIVS